MTPLRPIKTRRATVGSARSRAWAFAAALTAILVGPSLTNAAPPVGGGNAHITGVFGAPIPWTINGLHALVLPSGKVMSYGTNERGQQGGQFNYDIWDPALGTGLSAHTLLPNTTAVDIFCSGQSIIPATAEVLITGGDETIGGRRNYSTNQTNIFSETPTADLRPEGAMTFARWYPSLVTMPNGTLVAIGGRSNQLPNVPVTTPERYTPGSGWTLLTGVPSNGITQTNWYYPRTFVAPNGLIVQLSWDGALVYFDPAGTGRLISTGARTIKGGATLPVVMYAPGKMLAIGQDRQVAHVDLNGPSPVITPQPNVDQVRHWSNLTVMADGKLLLNGGSSVNNVMTNVAYSTLIWDPATGQWTTGASATKPRLYHSIALLLPDGSVLTGAGGSPGPIIQLNAEIYYPPYLYKKDGSGQPADRPAFTTVWNSARLGEGRWIALTPNANGNVDTVSRVTLVRLGSVTHSYNSEQRILDAAISGTDGPRNVRITLPTNPNRAVPGYYMMFVFNSAGTPSVAKIIRLTA